MREDEKTIKDRILAFLEEGGAPATFERIVDELGENADPTDALYALLDLRQSDKVDKLTRVFYVGEELDIQEAYATRSYAEAAFKEWGIRSRRSGRR